MDDSKPPGVGARTERDERLKSALRANIARRKAQARARRSGGPARSGSED